MCLRFIFFFYLLVSFDVPVEWVSVCVRLRVCVHVPNVAFLVRPPLNKESGFGCRFVKTKTHARLFVTAARHVWLSLAVSEEWQFKGCRLSEGRAYMTPWVPSMQLLRPVFHRGDVTDVGAGKHSRGVAGDVKLLTLWKGQANWNIDQRNIWILRVPRHFISPKIDRRCQMGYVEWKYTQECKQQQQPWSSISAWPLYKNASDFQFMTINTTVSVNYCSY